MLWDTHMHTNFSSDSQAEPKSMIEAAKKCGLGGICFTDHLDYDYPQEPEMFQLDVPEYCRYIRKLQEEYARDFPIRVGIELGMQPQVAGQYQALMAQHEFDFVIASSHVVHGWDPYYEGYYEGKTEEMAYREYFESILENLDAYGDFDVYGHIDYVVRYGPNKNRDYSYEKYRDILDEVLRRLIHMGKGIEINTGGFKYGLGHPNPEEKLLARYRELGGEIITIGADAHTPEHVAYDFEKVPAILREAGFSYYTVFEKRKPMFMKIDG